MDHSNNLNPAPRTKRGPFVPPVNQTPLENPLWRDKRRPVFGQPWSFTTYTLYPDRLIIESGILSIKREEIRLYRVMDITMRQTLLQRIFRIGTLRMTSMDSSQPRCSIRDVCFPEQVMQLLSDVSNNERLKYGFSMMEFMGPGF